MRKKWLVLSSLGLVVAACSDNSTAPTQSVESRAPAMVLGAPGARTKIMLLRGTQPVSGGVSTQATGINYHGGVILPQTKVAAIYWASSTVYAGGPAPGTKGTGAQDGSLVGHFLRNFGGSPYFNINTTYFDQVGGGHTVQNKVTYVQYWADNTSVPPANGSAVTDPTIQAEIVKGFNNGSLTYDPQTIYAVFTLGNTNLGGGFGSQYCAYHGDFTWNGNLVLYAAQPYVGQFLNGCSNGSAAPNGDAAADAVINVLAHEIEESTTDPHLDAWWETASGMENADKCAWTFGTTYNNGTGVANMNLGGKDFLIQQNWINAGSGGCLKSYTTGSNQPPVAAFASSCNNTTRACTFNGSGSTDDVGIVSYSWNFGDGSAAGSGVGPSHTYATTGTFQATLTVTDGGGLTNAVTHPVTISSGTNQPPVAAWTVSCQPAPAHVCTFNGTGSRDPDGSIVAYKWTNSGGKVVSTLSNFTRTFERSMSLTWTLTVTDNGGKTAKLTKTFKVP